MTGRYNAVIDDRLRLADRFVRRPRRRPGRSRTCTVGRPGSASMLLDDDDVGNASDSAVDSQTVADQPVEELRSARSRPRRRSSARDSPATRGCSDQPPPRDSACSPALRSASMSAIRAAVGSRVVVGASDVVGAEVVAVVVAVVDVDSVAGGAGVVVGAAVPLVVVGSASSLPEHPAAATTVSDRATTISDRIGSR